MSGRAQHPGFFLTFEGSEGCGKSTQIRLLTDSLRHIGIDPVEVREPGGTAVGEAIRHLLQHDQRGDKLVPEAELLLFAASRAQLVREVIRPALSQGRMVISDRFVDSTTVYQGFARSLDLGAVRNVNRFAVGDCVPDLTILLDLDAATGMDRVARRAGSPRRDRMEQMPLEFYESVRYAYRAIAKEESHRFRLIDASLAEGEIARQIRTTLADTDHVFFKSHRL